MPVVLEPDQLFFQSDKRICRLLTFVVIWLLLYTVFEAVSVVGLWLTITDCLLGIVFETGVSEALIPSASLNSVCPL